MRKLLLVAGVVGTTAACTSLLGDFTLGSSTDGGTTGDGGNGGETSAPPCNVTAPMLTAYVGQTITLTATSTSSNPSFTWSLAGNGSAPSGSNAMVQTSGTTSTFTPDVPGTYTFVVAVTGSGCSSYSNSATLTAYLPSVIFAQGSTSAPGGSSLTYVVSSQDGGAPSPIMCAVTNANVKPGDDVAHYAAYGGRAFDFWEAPAGTPSNYAAFTIDYTAGSGYFSHLWAGTTSSDCMSPPQDETTNDFGPGSPQGGPNAFFGSEPSFSPDGSHFVVYDNNLNIVVYVSNSKTHNMVAPYSSQGGPVFDPSGRGSLYVYPPRVAWQSNSMAIDWARSTASSGQFEIVSAPISTGTVSTVMTCSGVTPREIAVLQDGSIIASFRTTMNGPENLYHLTPAGGCTETPYTTLTDATDVATDFSVSPDYKTIAFLEQTSGMLCPGQTSSGDAGGEFCPGGNVFIVPVDNSSPPAQLGTDTALYGPRWIGGGTRLVYTRLDGVSGTAPATSIVTVSPTPGATNSQVMGKGDGTTTFASTNGSAACSFGGTAAPSAAGLLSLAAALGLVRRRRARKC